MVKVKNVRAGILLVSDAGLQLAPGAVAEMAAMTPQMERAVATGHLVLVREEPVSEPEPVKPADDLSALPATDAVARVQAETDVAVLQAWLAAEKRRSVAAAINARVQELGPNTGYGAAPDDGLKVMSAGDLTVSIQAGAGFVNNLIFRTAAVFSTTALIVPATYPRIDLVEADAAAGVISIKQGVEAESPVAPAADADCLVLAHVYCRPGMTSIQNSDDSINGYIIDQRVFI